ncbi:MAG: hypothetical protein K6G03_00680, partial [Lachnospiraceae bacterium]|nr:hypothetical protein [Lachnospiraceae bacterium]
LEAFSEDICRWLEYCFDRLPYEEGKTAYTGFIPEIPGYQNTKYYFSEYSLENFEGDHTDFYNSLYTYLNRYINHEYDALFNISGNDSSTYDMDSSDDGILEVSEDNIKIWSSYEPAAVYDFPDGTEYALVAVDRALGSSFYVLLSYGKKGEPDSAQLVTDDPFNGSTGEAKFITFLDDQKTGFAALTYNGGCEGMLFITRDKGATFSYVNLPSPEILLPNGQKYNPFVMPEEVWEESGKIYLKIGQGPEGDHYSEELGGKTAGIYVSDNDGRSFEFVKEELVEE